MTTANSAATPLPVLILLHGAGGNQAMWNPMRRHLDPRLQVVTLDLPSHGSRKDGHFTLEAAAALVAAEVQRLAPAPVMVGGDSLGGYTSIAAARAIPPDRLAGLVLGGCTQQITGKTLWTLRIRKLMVRIMAALMGEKRLVARSADALVKKDIRRDDMDAIVAAGMRLGAFGEAVDGLANRDTLAQIPGIQQRILFINGDLDEGPVAHEAEFVAAARDASVQRFACEHGVSLWKPAEFATAVNHFVLGLAERAVA